MSTVDTTPAAVFPAVRRYYLTKAFEAGDEPDMRRLLGHIEEGGGVLSQNKRKQFDELTDAEVSGIVAAYNEAFRSSE